MQTAYGRGRGIMLSAHGHYIGPFTKREAIPTCFTKRGARAGSSATGLLPSLKAHIPPMTAALALFDRSLAPNPIASLPVLIQV